MLRVMLVDDEIWTLRDLEVLLAEYTGYEIVGSFTNSVKAEQALLQLKPDVLLTDLRMSVRSGQDLINTAYANKLKTKIVIISAYSDFEVAREGLSKGVFDYLLKPIKKSDLQRVFERLNQVFAQEQGNNLAANIHTALDNAAAYENCCCVAYQQMRAETCSELLKAQISGACRITTGQEKKVLLVSYAGGGFSPSWMAQQKGKMGFSRVMTGFSAYDSMVKEAQMSLHAGILYAEHAQTAEVQAYLALHYNQDITLEQLSEYFHLSMNYLSMQFTKRAGVSCMGFLKHLRVAMAAHLLATTDLSMNQIAENVGYRDDSYFSRVFKAEQGLSPSAYRQKMQKQG